MRKSIIDEDFDVFIAYHGTNDVNGSLEMANYVYEQLSKIAKCFLMPISAPTSGFTDTPTVATHSKLFVLVANESIPLNNKDEIKNPGLYNEIDAFFKAHFDNNPSDYARVFAYNGLTAKKADSFHVLFRGHPHFEDTVSNSIDNLIKWVQSSLSLSQTGEQEQDIILIQQKKSKIHYEGLWNVSGEFNLFQGVNDSFTSVGRLLLQRSITGYKVLYCYGVSREYVEQNCVTAICDGSAIVEYIDSGKNEVLHVTCDIIAYTSDTRLQRNHFKMTLIPQSSDIMTTDYTTQKTKGKIFFTRKE